MAGRVTQLVVEAVISPTSAAVRTTQLVVEAVISPTSAVVRTTQLVVEAVVAPTSQNLVVSHLGLEVARFGDPNVLISQSGLEVARGGYPNLGVSQAGFEVAWEVPKGTFTLGARILPPPVTMTFGTQSVFYGYSGTPILLKQGAKGQSLREFVIPGCDLSIAGSPITITWDVWQSHFQWATDKKEIVRLRRDSLSGIIMWHDDPQKNETDAGNAATGTQWHFAGTYRESARSGRYVLSIYPDKGDASLYASYIFFQLEAPGDGPGVTLDATRLKVTPGSFRVAARILKPSGPITMPDSDKIDAVIKGGRSGSIDVGAILYIWGLGAFITSALIGKTTTSSFSAGAHVRAIPEGSFAANAVIGVAGSGSFSLDALVKGSHFMVSAWRVEPNAGYGSTQVDAIALTTISTTGLVWVDGGWIDPPLYLAGIVVSAVRSETAHRSFAVDALVAVARLRVLGLGAVLEGPTPSAATVDAFISGAIFLDAVIRAIGACVWTTPGDTVVIGQNERLAFLIPFAYRTMVFEIQLDRVATFDSPELRRIHSILDPGWEYWDGAWVPMSSLGVDPAFAGNEARYTIVDPLLGGTWYRRVRAGVI